MGKLGKSLAAVAVLSVLAPSASAQVPNVTLDWVGIHEMVSCAKAPDKQRHLRARNEIERRLSEFQRIWADEGPFLLSTAAEVAGQPFHFREALGVIHVCEDQVLGVSYPLLINIKWFLDAYEGRYRKHPLWKATFAELVFHEVLHRYIRDALGRGQGEPFRSTELMRRYGDEALLTRTHLHHFAIERAVYARLGRSEVVAMTREYGRDWPAYVRAHQIVDELGTEAVLEDFRKAARERALGAK